MQDFINYHKAIKNGSELARILAISISPYSPCPDQILLKTEITDIIDLEWLLKIQESHR